MTPHPDQLVSLPTRPFVLIACAACVAAAAAWCVVAALLRIEALPVVAGPLAASAVAAAAVIALLSIRPWRPRPLVRWPAVWMAGSAVRMVVTLALAFLLYSATPYGSLGLWLAVVVAYMATLIAETRLYALQMKRYAPPPKVDGAAASE